MKLPINCPVCGDIMLTEFKDLETTYKSCTKRLNHRIIIISYHDHNNNDVDTIKIRISNDPQIWVTWDFLFKDVYIESAEFPETIGLSIPFFKPDLSDYRKLVDKVKTYIVFS